MRFVGYACLMQWVVICKFALGTIGRDFECAEQPWAGTALQRSDDTLGKPGFLCAILEADGGIQNLPMLAWSRAVVYLTRRATAHRPAVDPIFA